MDPGLDVFNPMFPDVKKSYLYAIYSNIGSYIYNFVPVSEK